jgi:hypothetical protein
MKDECLEPVGLNIRMTPNTNTAPSKIATPDTFRYTLWEENGCEGANVRPGESFLCSGR